MEGIKMEEYIIDPIREVEMEVFESFYYDQIIDKIREFIKANDLYEGDIIGLNIDHAVAKWYATLMYAGAVVEEERGTDRRSGEFDKVVDEMVDNISTQLN